jgi:IS30 family transposase
MEMKFMGIESLCIAFSPIVLFSLAQLLYIIVVLKSSNIQNKLNCNMYFADPYCAWQKGTNENLNGLLREFYPKGRNLSRVSPETLKKNLELINSRPKKILYFNKPVDLFEFFLKKCCT